MTIEAFLWAAIPAAILAFIGVWRLRKRDADDGAAQQRAADRETDLDLAAKAGKKADDRKTRPRKRDDALSRRVRD